MNDLTASLHTVATAITNAALLMDANPDHLQPTSPQQAHDLLVFIAAVSDLLGLLTTVLSRYNAGVVSQNTQKATPRA